MILLLFFWGIVNRFVYKSTTLFTNPRFLNGVLSEALTDELLEPLGFVLPPDAEEVNGNAGSDDAESDAALSWSFPDGHDDQEETRQNEGKRQQDVHL